MMGLQCEFGYREAICSAPWEPKRRGRVSDTKVRGQQSARGARASLEPSPALSLDCCDRLRGSQVAWGSWRQRSSIFVPCLSLASQRHGEGRRVWDTVSPQCMVGKDLLNE